MEGYRSKDRQKEQVFISTLYHHCKPTPKKHCEHREEDREFEQEKKGGEEKNVRERRWLP